MILKNSKIIPHSNTPLHPSAKDINQIPQPTAFLEHSHLSSSPLILCYVRFKCFVIWPDWSEETTVPWERVVQDKNRYNGHCFHMEKDSRKLLSLFHDSR